MESKATSGIFNIDKPRGMTSRDLVNRVARIYRGFKVGHAGTLDPLARGVLVVPVGAASRLVPYLHLYSKTYMAQFELGASSPSADLETPVIREEHPKIPTRAELVSAAQKMTGLIQQVPPAHSAVKVDGVRAYEAARAGKEIVIQPRKVLIEQLRVIAYEYPILTAEITCSTGTYIRSLGCDWAALLGTNAVMTDLVRTSVGPYSLEDAISWGEETTETLSPRLRPMEEAVGALPRIELSDAEVVEIRHGRPIRHNRLAELLRQRDEVSAGMSSLNSEISMASIESAGSIPEWAAFDARGTLHAILVERQGALGPKRVFPVDLEPK